MKSPSSMKLCVAGVSVAAVFGVSGCATEEAFQPTPIGATWTYAQHNTGSFAAQLGASDVQQHRVEAGRVRKRHCRALRD